MPWPGRRLPSSLDGLTVNLIDTAGVRRTDDKVERIGIERTLQAVESADVVVHLTSADRSDQDNLEETMRFIGPRLRDGVVFLQVKNKMDLNTGTEEIPEDYILISAKTGQGLEDLVGRLKDIAGACDGAQGDFLARTRHLDCIARALDHVNVIRGGVGSRVGLDIAAEELRLAGLALGEIVGQTVADDLLGMIFSKFCIGK